MSSEFGETYPRNSVPSPPQGKLGWPWDKLPDPLPKTLPDGSNWPKISIITPSFNQGQFLEETIRSVILQGYPNLEYFVIDGGSTDNSVEIIKKYAPWITDWVSEPDRGQGHAINKGFERSSGDFVGWLNSDDLYCHNAFANMIVELTSNTCASFAYGICEQKDEKLDQPVGTKSTGPWNYIRLLSRCYIGQPATLINTAVVGNDLFLDETLYNNLDWDLWLRIGAIAPGVFIQERIAVSRMWAEAKTIKNSANIHREHPRILFKLLKNPDLAAGLDIIVKRELGKAYLRLGRHELKDGQYGLGIRHVLSALCMSPVLPGFIVGLATHPRVRSILDR